jgi:DNA-binding LacI/PurR family transcriptional regulator
MLEKEDLKYYPELKIKLSMSDNDIISIIDDLFENDMKADAIIFDSYCQAFKAYQYINDAYSKYDSNILIMSLNSNDLMLHAKPNITYLNLQGSKMGEEAAKLVFKQINGNTKANTKIMFSRLIIKSSSISI